MFKYIIILITFLAANVLQAQEIADNFYIKILSKELDRNMQKLHLPDQKRPFFISYYLRHQNSLQIRAERGRIVSRIKTPVSSSAGGVKLRVGNYHRNFDYMLYDDGYLRLPQQADAHEYQRLFWLETDRAYKNATEQYNNYTASLNRVTVDKKELALDDMARITPVTKDFGSMPTVHPDRKIWEPRLEALSDIFKQYPAITSSNCQLNVTNFEEYLVTSEGTKIRKPGALVSFFSYASATGENGIENNDSYSFFCTTMEELPETDFLRSRIQGMIQNILKAEHAKRPEGSYLGPVLFEDEAAPALMQQVFGSGLSTQRKSILGYSDEMPDMEDKLGQKLVSADLTVTALPRLRFFDGKGTTGSFFADGQGVIPPDSITLISRGLLTALINGRTPTQKFPKSQGFAASFNGRHIGPGVLKITSASTLPAHLMKERLLKLAKEEGLKTAYIIRSGRYTSAGLYEVDVTTGKETLMRDARVSPLNVRSFRRFITASASVKLTNTANLSIIAPESFLLNEVEIEKINATATPKPMIVSNPLLSDATSKKIRKKKVRMIDHGAGR